MRYGLIDIGSNTIRGVVYEAEGTSFKELITKKEFTGILNYIEDGCLNDAGLLVLKETVARLFSFCRLLNCAETHAFATASLRNLQNGPAVLAKLAQEGLTVRLLSAKEEAACDFYGLLAAGCPDNGLGFDLGGGSCQIFTYEKIRLQQSVSLPMGSLAMYNSFVRGILPTQKERKAIAKFAQKQLAPYSFLSDCGYQTIFAIGGTIRATAKLHRAFLGQDIPINGYLLQVSQLEDLCALLKSLDMQGIRMMEKVAPERITTLLPGLTVIQAVCRYTGAQQIKVVKKGVREGYLCHYLLHQKKS